MEETRKLDGGSIRRNKVETKQKLAPVLGEWDSSQQSRKPLGIKNTKCREKERIISAIIKQLVSTFSPTG